MVRRRIEVLLSHRYFVPGCMAAGIVLRLLWIWLVRADQVSDFAWYYQRGIDIAAGRGYSVNGIRTAYWPAGYPLFLGGLFYLFGPMQLLGKLANVVLYSATIWLSYWFARRVFHSEHAGRIAVCLLAFNPNQTASVSVLSTEILFQCLFLMGAVLFVLAEGRPGWIVLSGAIWGLATLTKTQAVFVPIIFLLVFMWKKRAMLKTGILAYTAVLLVCAPWLVRNYLIFGKPLLSTNGGIVLMIGNNPYATGRQIWDQRVQSLLGDLGVEESQLFDGRELAREERAKQVASDYIANHPGRVLLFLWPRKLVATYLSDVDGFYYSLGMVKNHNRLWQAAYLGFRIFAETYYVAILALFAFAIPTIVHSNVRCHRIGLFLVAYFTLVYLVYFGNARYHFALMPWITIYAAIGAERILKKGWNGGKMGTNPHLAAN
jgi:4-amino-4-deoxy-L-arabinose transferase-like glycosyltransferase